MKLSDAATQVTCPQCGKVAERIMSAGAGLLFKGSGFYITDYGKDGKKDQRKAPDPGKSESSGSGGEGTSKPKPDTSSSKGSGSSDT